MSFDGRARRGGERAIRHDPDLAASAARSQDLRRGLDRDIPIARNGHRPAGPGGAAGIQRPTVGDIAARSGQLDLAIVAGDALRADQAGVVDGAAHQVVRRLRRHHHPAAVGDDLSGVVDAGLLRQRGLVHRETYQPAVAQLQRRRRAAGQHHLAQLRLDDPGVLDVIAGQHDETAIAGLDRAAVDHTRTGRTAAGKNVVAGEKVRILDIHRRGDQAADVELGPRRKQHTVRVDQEHPPVGAETAENLRRRAADHPVQHHAAGGRLDELHVLVAADVELLPVDDGRVRTLVNHRAGGRGVADGGLASHHHAAGWPGQGQPRQQQGCHGETAGNRGRNRQADETRSVLGHDVCLRSRPTGRRRRDHRRGHRSPGCCPGDGSSRPSGRRCGRSGPRPGRRWSGCCCRWAPGRSAWP